MIKLSDCSIWNSLIWVYTVCYRVFQNTRAEDKVDVFYGRDSWIFYACVTSLATWKGSTDVDDAPA